MKDVDPDKKEQMLCLVSHEDMIAHLKDRAAHYEEKAKKAFERASEKESEKRVLLEEVDDDEEQVFEIKASTAYANFGNEAQSARAMAINYNNKAKKFRFYADHLARPDPTRHVPNPDMHRLQEQDLRYWELIP